MGGTPDGLFVVNPGDASSNLRDIQLAANADAAGYLVGGFLRDRAALYLNPQSFDDLLLEIGSPSSVSDDDVWFARSVGYAGNIDADPESRVDLVIGAPSTEGGTAEVGYVFLALAEPSGAAALYRASTDTVIEVLPAPLVGTRLAGGLELRVPDAPRRRFGSFVAGGFDYDDDGHPDVAVVDTTDGSIWLYY